MLRVDGEPLILALAPMDGVTDWIHREVLSAALGGDSGIAFCVSEFVRVTGQPAPAKVLRRLCPELDRGGVTSSGVPVVVQLLGGDPEPLARTARLAAELGAPGVDLNFGCPAKTVNRHDGGATLLKYPGRLEGIVRAVRAAVPSEVPVSAKIRTGWDRADDVVTLARAAEQGGASWLTIHGRTRCQGYGGQADWDAIARARAALAIPVLANGDLTTPERIEACRLQTGCRAMMVGRGALADPGLFLRALGRGPVARPEALLDAVLPAYVARVLDADHGDHSALNRLKQWLCLGSRVAPELAPRFEAIKRERDVSSALAALRAEASAGATVAACHA